ncbi:hypothetical protein [Prauserella muralis]|uniref:Uncharacterized protein n=1 Tax=Prauserella muralis TaxID=588067 RepID=A0A2V4BN18_9PSEU|nr:hypothetical protein [Prauserella muralis]PXY32033.1 hypothetical protein BAY60_06895 [Prauserella muralis]TWE13523.1 hypothetical protein FHX69_5646 [Prauserella muralis]
MLYLLAAIGAITIAVLLWRVFGAERVGVPSRQSAVAPDDDPEFLRSIGEQSKRPEDDEKG